MKYFLSTAMILLLFLTYACRDDEDREQFCDKGTWVCPIRYGSSPDDPLTISDLSISGDCLQIDFNASGCDGNSWEILLVDSSEVSDDTPPERNLRLSLDNQELCDAIVSKSLTFDISVLQVEGSDQVLLHLTNSGDSILYEY